MRQRSETSSLVRLLPALLMAAACGEAGDRAPVPMDVDPCTLLEVGELSEILGMQTGEGLSGVPAEALIEGMPAMECRWATPDNARTLTLILRRATTAEDAAATIEPVRESFESGGLQPEMVNDVGDEAFFAFNQLHVRAGADYFTITVTGLSNDEALAAARAAATQALPRLGGTEG